VATLCDAGRLTAPPPAPDCVTGPRNPAGAFGRSGVSATDSRRNPALKSCAYITVRNDRKGLKGKTSKGTWQGLVTLNLPIVRKTSGYITYFISKCHSDCTMKAEVLR
jgi:hypothetical protein